MSFNDPSFTSSGFTQEVQGTLPSDQSLVGLLVITTADISWHLSGGASNSDPLASMGAARSNFKIVDVTLNNIFDNVMPEQSLPGYVDHRCIYIRNAHASLTWFSVVIWISQPTESVDDEIDIGLGVSPIGGVEPTIPAKDQAPLGVQFFRPIAKYQALEIGDIPPLGHKAIWIRRVVNSQSKFKQNNNFALRVEGDTIPEAAMAPPPTPAPTPFPLPIPLPPPPPVFITDTVPITDLLIRTKLTAGATLKIRAPAAQTVTIPETLTRKKILPRAPAAQSTTISAGTVTPLKLPWLYDDFTGSLYNLSAVNALSPNGKWKVISPTGSGSMNVVVDSQTVSNVMQMTPVTSTLSTTSHFTQVNTTTTHPTSKSQPTTGYKNFDMTLDMKTISQLRTGTAPTNVEVARVLFRYTDPTHYYYFMIKTNGCELGRLDYPSTVTGKKIILMMTTTPILALNTWKTVRIKSVGGNHFTAYVAGVQVIDLTDDGTVGQDTNNANKKPAVPSTQIATGQMGLYAADAKCAFDNVKILRLP